MLDHIEKPPDADILAIVTEAVAIEKGFVCESLPVGLLGMNRYDSRSHNTNSKTNGFIAPR